MKFCQNCGKLMENHETYCSDCGLYESQIKESQAQDVDDTKKDQPAPGAPTPNTVYTPRPYEDSMGPYGHEEKMPAVQKIAFVLIPFLIPVVGTIVTLIFGIIYMNKKSSDYKNFGLIMVILSVISLLLQIFACCVFGALVLDELSYYYDFYYY